MTATNTPTTPAAAPAPTHDVDTLPLVFHDAKEAARWLAAVEHAHCDDETRQSLCGVFVRRVRPNEIELMTTDSYRLALLRVGVNVSCEALREDSRTWYRLPERALDYVKLHAKGTKVAVPVTFDVERAPDAPDVDQVVPQRWGAGASRSTTVWGINPDYLADAAKACRLVAGKRGGATCQPPADLYGPMLLTAECRDTGVHVTCLVMPMRL